MGWSEFFLFLMLPAGAVLLGFVAVYTLDHGKEGSCMRVYWRRLGGHIHMRVFHNGKMGDLVCSLDEFVSVKEAMAGAEFERDSMHPNDERTNNGRPENETDL